MPQNFQTAYQPFTGGMEEEGRMSGVGGGGVTSSSSVRSGGGAYLQEEDRDEDLSPDTNTSMVFHVVPKSSKTRWNHIEDLDSFFTRVYQYHQNHGLLCMMLQQAFELAQFIFIIVFTVFLFSCVDYDVLFRNKFPANFTTETDKITLPDAIRTHAQCMEHFSWKLVLAVIAASLFWVMRLGHACYTFFQFWEIKQFFNNALQIHDKDLGNITWEEVEQRVMEVQVEERMCIHKEVLTELDIYHRILRFTNYFVAMVNKNIIPLKMDLPFLGSTVFLTKGLRMNVEMLLFWGPWAPFHNNWHLGDEYKRPEKRHELAELLNKQFLYCGIANLVLFPLVLLFQIMYSFFYYADMIKREPGSLGSRRWSHYGEVYLRHFNELDHEMSARLNRGYKAASQYMNIFSSPLMAVVARHIAFVCGAVLAVLAALSVYDEDVLQVEHVLTLMTVLGALMAGCRVFIPDENLVFCPEMLMRRVLAEVHYVPDHWREKAHTSRVRREFSQLFQYRVVHMLEELVSPIVTPLILIFRLRFKALDIVDFYRNFTVEVVGVGDVCSFAQMDVRRHGSPTWQPDLILDEIVSQHGGRPDKTEMATDGGKTELSLLHFTMTNPKWKPPQESTAFINALRTQAQRDMNALPTLQEENALYSSINSLSFGGGAGLGGVGLAATSTLQQPPWLGAQHQSYWSPRSLRGRMSQVEGSRHGPTTGGVLSSIQQSNIGSSVTSGPVGDPVMAPSTLGPSCMMGPALAPPSGLPQDLTAVDMSLSTLYLHELHQRHRQRTTYTDTAQPSSGPQGPPGGVFLTPLAQPQEPPVVSFQRVQERTPLLGDP